MSLLPVYPVTTPPHPLHTPVLLSRTPAPVARLLGQDRAPRACPALPWLLSRLSSLKRAHFGIRSAGSQGALALVLLSSFFSLFLVSTHLPRTQSQAL